MDVFLEISLPEIILRYKNNELMLVRDLMKVRFLDPLAECHGSMVIDGIKPWLWRCANRECQKKKAVVRGSFLEGSWKFYIVFIALFMWATGNSMKDIIKSSGVKRTAIRRLVTEWRQVIPKAGEEPTGGQGVLVETDEMAIGSRKYQRGKRQRSTGVQWVCHS